MKRLKLLLILGIIISMSGSVSAQKWGTTDDGRLFIDCLGMPSGTIKTPSEVASSKTTGGRIVRHIFTDPVNSKVSPKFEISNGLLYGTWAEAAGWSDDANFSLTAGTAANTGCAAYDPLDDIATNGNWRLPTQREVMLVYVLFKRITLFSDQIWFATEYSDIYNYYLYFTNGYSYYNPKTTRHGAFCVRDM